jgi:transposase InsO family protein
LITLIVEIKRRNPRYGCPKIALLASNVLKVEITEDLVRRILRKHYNPDMGGNGSPSWLAAIGNAKSKLWSLDLFCCESILLKTHWVMVVMDQYSRSIVGYGVHAGTLNGEIVSQMFNTITAGRVVPKYLSTDHDPLFKSHEWEAALRVHDSWSD